MLDRDCRVSLTSPEPHRTELARLRLNARYSGRLARLGLSFQHVNLSLQLDDDDQQGLPAGGSQVKNGIHTSDLT